MKAYLISGFPLSQMRDMGVLQTLVEESLVKHGLDITRGTIKEVYHVDVIRMNNLIKKEGFDPEFRGSLSERAIAIKAIELGLPFKLVDSDYVVPGLDGRVLPIDQDLGLPFRLVGTVPSPKYN